ncbi:hypothetical protein OG618_06680 [Kitasatospora sp. NBC_01246]|uniref:hypothetical protein n=1 Tax=Kitasatospora sp. NBC_01246 TaxID=2903570 RepID=UPI002E34DBF1|nr:hypothetical protein [Kitasatospora sp. NBC_01246]
MRIPAPALRRVRLIAVIALFLGLLGFGHPASAAEPPPSFTLSVDHPVVTPGQVGTLTVTFTNHQSSDVQFLYVTTYASEQTSPTPAGSRPEFVSCTGDASACGFEQTLSYFNMTAPVVPIAPGESRSVRLAYRFTPESDCHSPSVVAFGVLYFYYEYAQGTQTYEGRQWIEAGGSPTIAMTCPAAA